MSEMIRRYLTKKKTMRPMTMMTSVLTMPITTPTTVFDTGTPTAVNTANILTGLLTGQLSACQSIGSCLVLLFSNSFFFKAVLTTRTNVICWLVQHQYLSFLVKFRHLGRHNLKHNKAIVDIGLRLRFCPLLSHFEYIPNWRRLCLANYGQIWCHPQNWKYIMYCIVIREGLSHDYT